MAVPTHTKYAKIAELKQELGSMYSKLTSINDDKFKSLVQAFMYDPSSKPVHVPNAVATDLISAAGVNSKVSDFQNLLKDAMDCHIEPNEISTSAMADNNAKMTGLLKFVKPQGAGGVAASSVKVEVENRVAGNIISSVNVINAFLDILKSYETFTKEAVDNATKDINNILIVGMNPKSTKNFAYVEAEGGDSLIKPAFSALYLQLNANIYAALIGSSTLEVYTRYDGNVVVKTDGLTTAVTALTTTASSSSTAEFVLDSSNVLSLQDGSFGYIRGLRIVKQGSNEVIAEYKEDYSAVLQEILNFDRSKAFNGTKAATGVKYAANIKLRDQYLLKHFLNIIINIKKESRYSTIKMLQTYYITMKALLLAAVNTGNHLYNSHIQTGSTPHSASANTTLFGLKGIDAENFTPTGLYTTDAINAAFKIDTNYVSGITGQDTTFHSRINNLISKITIESANSINVGTTMPKISSGFYAKKIDDKHIEISGLTSSNIPSSVTLSDWKESASNFLKTVISLSALEERIKKDFEYKRIFNIKDRYKITINDGRYDIVDISDDGTMYKYKIKASISDQKLYPKDSTTNLLDTTMYKILDKSGNTYTDSVEQQYIHKANYVIFKTSGSVNNVKLAETSPLDNAEEYNGLKSEIMGFNESINMNKSKITNHTTLYELHKSKHNVLNNQLISYYVIIAAVICVIIAINLANVEKALIKTIALGCFAVIILLFMSYYVMNVLYISEEFTVENFANAFGGTSPGSLTDEYSPPAKNAKKAFVQSRLDNYCDAIILALKILKPSLENSTLINTSVELIRIGKNESKERLYINNILINKRDNAEINIDVLKYENMNFAVHIKALLITALIVIGVYTLHFYTEPRYLDLLLFVTSILLISVFTYFVVYSNKIVRTIPTNNYWGREERKSYGML